MAEARPRPPLARRVLAFVAGLDDTTIIRAAFFALLAGTAGMLAVDYRELNLAKAAREGTVPGELLAPLIDPLAPRLAPGPQVTTDRALLDAPLAIALKGGGVLELTGTFDVGSAQRLAAELDKYGEYVETVSLDSPGGSVTDALAIGEAIRKAGFSTSVAGGSLCASSCPLVLAGGVQRLASQDAAIGVHQIYAMSTARTLAETYQAPALAMADAQKTTAAITRYLTKMGVSSDLWLHALETPPTSLYYLKPQEMTALRLVTELQ